MTVVIRYIGDGFEALLSERYASCPHVGDCLLMSGLAFVCDEVLIGTATVWATSRSFKLHGGQSLLTIEDARTYLLEHGWTVQEVRRS